MNANVNAIDGIALSWLPGLGLYEAKVSLSPQIAGAAAGQITVRFKASAGESFSTLQSQARDEAMRVLTRRQRLPIPGSLDSTAPAPSPSPSPTQSADIERDQCNQVERDYQQHLARFRSLAERAPGIALSSLEIIGILNFLSASEQHFLMYQTVSKQLVTAGLSKLSDRLTQIGQEIRDSIKTFDDLYTNMERRKSELATRQSNNAADALKNFTQANQYSQQIFDQALNAYFQRVEMS